MLMLFVQGEIELNPYHGHWRYALNLILHQDNASETFSSFQVIQQKTKRAGRISMIGRLSDRMFTLSTISTHQTLEYFFHTLLPSQYFLYSFELFILSIHRQEHGQLFLKCSAEKDSCTGKKSNQQIKKTTIQRFSL